MRLLSSKVHVSVKGSQSQLLEFLLRPYLFTGHRLPTIDGRKIGSKTI